MSNRFRFGKSIGEILAILCGVVLVSIGLEMFLTPHRILPGGIKGIAIFLSHVTEMKLGLILLYINLPFVIFRRRNLRKTISALFALIITTFLTVMMHPIPPFVTEPLLASLFGGVIFGLGIGLIVRNGWYVDGVNDVALYLKKKIRLSISELLMIINLFILTCGGFFFGWDQAIHSIIAYYTAFKAIQFTLEYKSRKFVCVDYEKPEHLTRLLIQECGEDVIFLTPVSQNVTELYFSLSEKNIMKFNSIIEKLESSARVVVTFANHTQAGPYYRI